MYRYAMFFNNDFVCLAIPKCAARAMHEWTRNYRATLWPGTLHHITDAKVAYEGRLVFMVVRNPYSRALSIWKHVRDKHGYQKPIEWLMMELTGRKKLSINPLFKPSQLGYLKRHKFPIEDVDVKYIKLENLDEGLKQLPFVVDYKPPDVWGKSDTDSAQEIESLSRKAILLINKWAYEDFNTLGYDLRSGL